MLNFSIKQDKKYSFRSNSGMYSDYDNSDEIMLEVQTNGDLIVFSINWIDHDISVAAISVSQTEELIDKLKLLLDKIKYEEAAEYFKKNKKIKLFDKK